MHVNLIHVRAHELKWKEKKKKKKKKGLNSEFPPEMISMAL
jgi:hypothetical protein